MVSAEILINIEERIESLNMLFSTEMHKICFLVFIATSELYMAISYVINKTGRKVHSKLKQIEIRSLRYKRNLCAVNVASFTIAGYCFLRHNALCEPYSEFHYQTRIR